MYTQALEDLIRTMQIWEGTNQELLQPAIWHDKWHKYFDHLLLDEESGKKVPSHQEQLAKAEPYYVESNICSLIAQLQETIPVITLRKELLITKAGWVTLANPFPLVRSTDDPTDLAAFSWSTEIVEGKEDGLAMMWYERCHPPYCEPFFYQQLNIGDNFFDSAEYDGETGLLVTDEKFNYKDPFNPDIPEQIVKARADQARRYILTFFTLINQRLLTRSRRPPNRSFYRRSEQKRPTEERLINVVELRKKYYAPSGEEKDVEWSCRWIVRGFWRSQPYSSLGIHRPIWISPFIKGPEDKPLKSPGTRLFDLDR